jgi:hypothetical protein
VTFYLLVNQYRKAELSHNLLNIRFMMMAGALVQVVVIAFSRRIGPGRSLVFFILAVVWFVGGIQLWRQMPPRPPKVSQY